ncbi:potassium channel family protein [Motilimonas cestriensis]|uniref:potassium channel family protein n=1 Tax=Motilimonas cestriensis TaxID=2742685 RepID=UPI003DA1F179
MGNLDYEQFISFLKQELESNDDKMLNDIETLVEFFEEYPPEELEDDVDSDYAKEEIERIANEEIITLLPKLKQNEKTWLTVENGKLKLLPCMDDEENSKTLNQELTDDELLLSEKHYDTLDKNDRESLLTLYDHKYLVYGTIEEKFELLEKLFNSYKYLDEKDHNYLTFIEKISVLVRDNKDKDFYKSSYKYHEDAAKYYRKKYDHEESALQFKQAAEIVASLLEAETENVEDFKCISLKLVRAMRIQYEACGDEENASKAFIEENRLNRLMLGKSEKSWIHIISDNCQNPIKVAMSACWLVIFSTVIFSLTGIETGSEAQSLLYGNKDWYIILWDSFYFSIVTFTTLGYGDFSPGEGLSRLIANMVSIFGLLLSSLFLVTLVRKYGR